MIPVHYPVTMTDPRTGHTYEVHSPAEYVSARFKRGHQIKAAPKTPTPIPSVVSEPVKPAMPLVKKES